MNTIAERNARAAQYSAKCATKRRLAAKRRNRRIAWVGRFFAPVTAGFLVVVAALGLV